MREGSHTYTRQAGSPGDETKYAIRPCEATDELAGCIDIQRRIWGYAEQEVYPLRLFVNLIRIGGNVLGAFSTQGDLVGFVASMPAWHERTRYYHSLSLGVLPGHEDRGVGRALKLAQREAALEAGLKLIEWTFDPLRAKNAFLNIERLGVVVRRYLPNYYGRVDSRLQQGLPSDRLVAEWWLKSARVHRALKDTSPRSRRKKPVAEVAIPSDFGTLAAQLPEEALACQTNVRLELEECFRSGLVITGFRRGEETSRYLLDKPRAQPDLL